MQPEWSDQQPQMSRLFIGISLDAATQRFLDGLVYHCKQQLGGNGRNQPRWTSRTNRHLTLAFLGDTPAAAVPSLEAGLCDIAQNVPDCDGRIVSLHPFPKARSRLLAAELLPNPALGRLYEHCRQLMLRLGMEPESAVFRPHITLARSRHSLTRMQPIATDFTAQFNNIVLYESHPTPAGSQYIPLFEVELKQQQQGTDTRGH